MPSSNAEPPPLSGRRLTGLLRRWGSARRLDARQADTIRQRVLAAPTDLGFDWWWRLLDPEHGSVFREPATRPAVVVPFESAADFVPFGPDQGAFIAWSPDETAGSVDEVEYQPYLRLT